MPRCNQFLVLGVIATATLATGCGQTGIPASVQPGTAPATSTPTSVSPTVPTPPTHTAARDLLRYFAAARRADARVHAAALAINAEIGTGGAPPFSQATRNAVERADPSFAAADIPAALPPRLMWAVLRVQNDLVASWWAFTRVEHPFSAPGEARSDLLRCLAGGAAAAARFPGDLAAARRLAAASPRVSPVAPGSRAAGTLAVRLATIGLANSGCDSCGGYLFSSLPVVRRHLITVGDEHWDGTVGNIPFQAIYHARTGWEIHLNAC